MLVLVPMRFHEWEPHWSAPLNRDFGPWSRWQCGKSNIPKDPTSVVSHHLLAYPFVVTNQGSRPLCRLPVLAGLTTISWVCPKCSGVNVPHSKVCGHPYFSDDRIRFSTSKHLMRKVYLHRHINEHNINHRSGTPNLPEMGSGVSVDCLALIIWLIGEAVHELGRFGRRLNGLRTLNLRYLGSPSRLARVGKPYRSSKVFWVVAIFFWILQQIPKKRISPIQSYDLGMGCSAINPTRNREGRPGFLGAWPAENLRMTQEHILGTRAMEK